MVLLADRATGTAIGGQALLGGLDVEVDRNHFGSQQASFESPLDVAASFREAAAQSGSGSASGGGAGDEHFRGVFIRAPAVLAAGTGVEPLAWLPPGGRDTAPLIVAVRQGPFLATAFHPELSRTDSSWHRYFVALVEKALERPLARGP